MSATMTERDTETPAYCDWLRQLRDLAGMTQLDLANRLMVDLSTYSRWENGHNYPRARLIREELNALGKRHGMPPIPKPPRS